jgi:indolepyruvate ferredoxin oxidoreductase beta subunit
MTINILFCGIGGQGVLTAAEVCGWAAVIAGLHAKKSEVHGMAQRGGSVESHVRIGEKVYSPLIPAGTVDFLVPFHPEEHARYTTQLKTTGIDLYDHLVQAKTKYMNTYLLGILSAKLPMPESAWLEALKIVYPEKSLSENNKIFMAGRNS